MDNEEIIWCRKCKHIGFIDRLRNGRIFARCMAHPRKTIDFVMGPIYFYSDCDKKNFNGHCPDFELRQSWLRKLIDVLKLMFSYLKGAPPNGPHNGEE